ncbi:MAG: hypothetical protein QTN59_05605 [Candidatus Electrothrix communis]|nr:MAG: hypothetical protein QTN59_05605 [Candidatus Electrothrix communis]
MNALLESIKNPIAISVVLAFYGLGWLLTKINELETLKNFFSKDRSEELKKAREELKDIPEEAAFYDEAVRQELFHTATRIRCSKKYRRMCQKLVTDGLASVEAIRHASIYIYEKNARAEVRFSWIEKIMAALLIPIVLFGILAIFVSLVSIASLFDVSEFPNTLFILSAGILFIAFPLQQLLPMIFAWGIRKRLKEREQEDAVSSPASAEELSSSVQDT